jgi:uncharacterized protein (TIGR02996 family)
MIGDGDALFRAILENPADDLPRLVFADWLQENGNPERAEFVRLQCEAWHLCPQYATIDEARTAASRLYKEHADEWHAELPALAGVEWSDLFVRGFVDAAWVEAGRNVRSQLDAVFAATPLLHLTAINFRRKGLEVLFKSPYPGRLATLRREGHGSGYNAGVGELVKAAAERFPTLRIL